MINNLNKKYNTYTFSKIITHKKICKWVEILLVLNEDGPQKKQELLSFVNTSNMKNLTYKNIIKYENTNKSLLYYMKDAQLINWRTKSYIYI